MLNRHLKFQGLFFSFLFLSFNFCKAQKEVTDFGVFTSDDIYLKECSFDKDADAVVLFEKAKSYYTDNYYLVTEKRIRFKILKERGIKRGDIHIRYYSDEGFESISGIDAVVVNVDNQENQTLSKLDKKSIYNKRLNKYYSEVSFALPDIKVGSIIEYKYQSEMKNYGGLREWIFQSEMPVVLSSYYLIMLPNAEFTYGVFKNKELPITIKPDPSNGGILFEMSNIAGLRDEAYMGAARDYLQRVKLQFSGYSRVEAGGYGTSASTTTKYTNTWKDLARELTDDADFGSQINKTLSGADILQQTWAKETNEYTRMKAIHEYVKSHFSWDHIYSKYADEGVKNVWEKKTGNSGEINLILINLLKSAGLAVNPLLVSERDYGKIDTVYPFLSQFEKVVAYVTAGGQHYVLDGTDHETPSFIIPFDLLNTTGFIVDKKNASLIKLIDDTRKNLNTVTLIGNINDDGLVELEAGINDYDYAKIEKKEKYISDKNKYEKEFFEPYTITSLDTFAVDGLESDSLPLHHDVKVRYTLNKTGDYYLLNYNFFTGLNKNPFITPQRFTDINFGSKYSCTLTAVFNLPDNLVVETLPKSVKLVMPDESMLAVRQLQQDEKTIQIVVRANFYKTEYTVNNYPEVQAFYKQMLELLNEPIVLKAKK